ncbi:MAG: ferredoxin reductase family protein [bacterium]|nr:ferredoxin reductase family protein [bacterium]
MYNPGKALFLKLLYFGFFLVGAYLTLGRFTTNISLYQLGQIFGTFSLTGLTLQLWMGVRVKILERGVGLPQILKWHSLNGKLTLLFVLLHPLLMFGPFILDGMNPLDLIASYTIYHWFGVSALLLIMFTLVITLWQAKLKVNYEHWKFLHKVGYLIIFLGFTHALFIGSDIVSRGPLYYWWWILLTMTVGAVAYRYGIRNIALRDSLYRIVEVVKESSNVRSIVMEPMSRKVMSYFPGQFAFVKFYSEGVSPEEHHFTLSSAPCRVPGGMISFTVKGVGDYTKMLGNLKTGDKARIEGPFGVFSNEGLSGPFVFIAGGIGITPIMSMIRGMRDSGRGEETLLIYSAKTTSDLVFKKELDDLARRTDWFRAVYLVGKHVDLKILKTEVKDFKNSKFFVCGPSLMMDLVEKLLLENGARKEVIFTEKFALK